MRARSLVVLGVVFFGAFIGRAAVLAAALAETAAPGEAPAARKAPLCLTGALAETLKRELELLEARKTNMAEDEQTMRVLGRHVEERIAELETLNQSALEALEKIESAKSEDARRVSAIYERMKPPLAGAIIGEMDPEFAAGLFLAMSGESASAIMATLAPERAYAITVLMAGRS